MDEATLFLVRVWRHGRTGFRASARRVDEESAHLFSEADALARYLAQGPLAVAPPASAFAPITPEDAQ
jgi:hypothetical protein